MRLVRHGQGHKDEGLIVGASGDEDPGVCLCIALGVTFQKGHQPMLSSTGASSFPIMANSTTRPFREELAVRLREWRGHSDTETLLACIEIYGVERTLAKNRWRMQSHFGIGRSVHLFWRGIAWVKAALF